MKNDIINLPIDQYEEAIVDAVENNDFTIIVGRTGSGKTTRVPRFLIDKFHQVIVTEPRILTVKNASNRIAEEMGVTLGKEVGYKTGYDKCYSANSKTLFCTDGLQLVRTINMKNSTKPNVLVIDEAHLWNINMEALVAWCKFMQNKWNTKVVIMSATMDAEKLKIYLGEKTTIINVPGRLHEVEVSHRPAYMLIPTVREYVQEKRDTLIFVSGKKEMEDLIGQIKESLIDAVILPLHGELEWEEQKKCFLKYDLPKIIVATNIAQEGITIPGISVIDTGKAKISVTEAGVEALEEVEISKADCKQREGRAGRTEGGRYTLCSDFPYENRADYTLPEIQRSILDRIVLHLAVAGLDAEKLEFFHQPNIDDIKNAKRKLVKLGALNFDNSVTELGHKMAKLPVSVELSRMICEAEKYGVTEQVITIAAIMEMGGLLYKGRKATTNYNHFSSESQSDLLAELDVWEHLSKIGYINFKEVGVNKKNYFRIKKHIKKLKEAVSGLIMLESNDNREAILSSCIAGMVNNIFVHMNYMSWTGEDGACRQLDKSSCLTSASTYACIIGIPKNIPCKSFWGNSTINVITFATGVQLEQLEKLLPNEIEQEVTTSYNCIFDEVIVQTRKYFRGVEIDYDSYSDRNHPDYQHLKAEYEAEQERLRKFEDKRRISSRSFELQPIDNRQREIIIDNTSFQVDYDWKDTPYVTLDKETLFSTEEKEVFLDNGKKVLVHFNDFSRNISRQENIVTLRNLVIDIMLKRARDEKKSEYSSIQVCNLNDVLKNCKKIGAVTLITGYKEEPLYGYGCVSLKKQTVSFELLNDEEKANEKTKEALQFLFQKHVDKNYPVGKFSTQKGKKKKVLTPEESKMRSEFNSLVRELLLDLNIENAKDSLEFLEEYFLDITKGLQKAVYISV